MDGTAAWGIVDNKRDPINPVGQNLYPDATTAEAENVYCDFLANGFKLRGTSGFHNGSGGTIIYAAYAEMPFKYANAR